jgi:hypothetical protein
MARPYSQDLRDRVVGWVARWPHLSGDAGAVWVTVASVVKWSAALAGHWQCGCQADRRMAFLAALRCDRITAPCVIDGRINGTSFRAYIEQFLVPTLSPGDVVVMDNLGSHKGKAVRRLIRAAGAKLSRNGVARSAPELRGGVRRGVRQRSFVGHAITSARPSGGFQEPLADANYGLIEWLNPSLSLIWIERGADAQLHAGLIGADLATTLEAGLTVVH